MEPHHQKSDWREAIAILVKFCRGGVHLDTLLDSSQQLHSRWLIMETFRKWLVIEAILSPHLRRNPRPETHNLLRLAVAEFLVREAKDHPKVVHFAGEVAKAMKLSKPERGFVNGVLRSVLRAGPSEGADLRISHPAWLIKRWKRQFGEAEALRLLEWNQSVPSLHVRAPSQPPYGEETPWAGYYRVIKGRSHEAIHDAGKGKVYIQDPFTRIPVDLLNPVPGEQIMDLCAAPGGKSRFIHERLKGRGRLILVDRPGVRLDRLKANSEKLGEPHPDIIGCPLEGLDEVAPEHGLAPASMDAVMIDVPCSNTGVIRKRPDVKLRLKDSDIRLQAKEQLKLIGLAARWVRPGGRLVYSTCSLEPEENTGVVSAFLEAHPGWQLENEIISLPWECRHDGGGAFLLTLRVSA